MKHYLLEPTYKKSLVEYTIFRRMNENNDPIFLRKELGWRWGSFIISVPETEEEAMDYLKSKGYEGEDAIFDWAEAHGHTIWDGEKEHLDPDTPLLKMIESQLLPLETDEFVDITEDYEDAEMQEAWDGCWEFWSVDSYKVELTEADKEAMVEEAEEAYQEEYEEGVEELGWEFVDSCFELHCNPKITPCDENGKVFETEEQEELDAV